LRFVVHPNHSIIYRPRSSSHEPAAPLTLIRLCAPSLLSFTSPISFTSFSGKLPYICTEGADLAATAKSVLEPIIPDCEDIDQARAITRARFTNAAELLRDLEEDAGR